MATRKIKDAKDLSTNELIYFKGHAQATYMSNGATVEDVINALQDGSGGIKAETDPVFLASPAASITSNNISSWNNKQDVISDIDNIRIGANKGATAVQPSSLAAVATSGNYNDLTNKPTIPASVTESTVSGWGFTKNIGTYIKPSTGIPVSDLAEDIQTSLGKANTALQSYTEQYKGTITGVSANGTSVATSGVANIPAATTSKYGVTKLSSSTSSTSTSLAATASAVKAAYDLANGKQEKLTSGTNIKTINGESILGSGDIVINPGSASKQVIIKTSEGVLLEPPSPIEPNTVYVYTTPVTSVMIFDSGLDDRWFYTQHVNNIPYAEYSLIFTTSDSGCEGSFMNMSSTMLWANGKTPEFEPGVTYELNMTVVKMGNDYVIKAVLVPFKEI